MTLFQLAAPGEALFRKALDGFYGGGPIRAPWSSSATDRRFRAHRRARRKIPVATARAAA